MSEDQIKCSRRSYDNDSSFCLINKLVQKKPIYIQIGKNAIFYNLKLQLLNFFASNIRDLITGFCLVREGPPEDNDNDTISDNYFDDKYNDAKVYDFLKLVENKQIYKKDKNGCLLIYFRTIKLTLNITVVKSGNTQKLNFPLSLKDNTINKYVSYIKEAIQEPISDPYYIFQDNPNLDGISEEDDMKQYSEVGLIMFLFPIQVLFVEKSTNKNTQFLFKSNEPLSNFLQEIFNSMSIENDPTDYSYKIENDDEKIDIELPVIQILRKKRTNEFTIEIFKKNSDVIKYKMISKIGEGNFGKVYKVRDQQNNEIYAAKVANLMINESTKDSEEVKSLFREVNLMSLFNHPSIIKFIGYYPMDFKNEPFPTIITEFAVNGSLRNLIQLEISGLSLEGWDITKKLINIYGIASGMSYLHNHNVLHRDLKPDNILVDEYLHPKITDFGLSKVTDFLSVSMNYKSQANVKGTPAYMSPEILNGNDYSKEGDVYAFALIVLELMTGEVPFKNENPYQVMKQIIDGYRPNISDEVPDQYRELIESCWAQEPKDRPSFDEIVTNLKENEGFITDITDEAEFYDYIDFIDNYQSTFDVSKRIIHFSDFIENQGRKKTVQKVKINENE